MSSLPASMKRIGSKATDKRWRHRFPHYKSMGPFYCHGNQSFDPICPKTLCSLSPTPVMLHIKFDQDWPTGFRDIQVWKCGRRRRRTTTDGGPLVYYKLTLWAFGSGELIMCKNVYAWHMKEEEWNIFVILSHPKPARSAFRVGKWLVQHCSQRIKPVTHTRYFMIIKWSVSSVLHKKNWAVTWQNQQNECAPSKLGSAWTSAQSDQSLRCSHEKSFGP